MREALRAGNINEDKIRQSLTECKGDLFLTASMLGCTVLEVDRYIRSSDSLQGFTAAIATVKADPEYERMSAEQFDHQIATLTRGYRIEALDVIHQLATMDYDTAALAEVKLKAAVQLRGSHVETSSMDNSVLQELNQLYQEQSVRIKSIRVAQIEFQGNDPQNPAA